jgi:7-carboxy-7-deazaguanine synthase
MSVEDVLTRVCELSNNDGKRVINVVELTGGEPLLQNEIYPLIDRLLEQHFQVLIETSGERFIGEVPTTVVRVVDVKCPDSGEGDTFNMENLAVLASHDQCKFVIASRNDYEWARSFVREHHLAKKVEAVIFSPAFESQPARSLAEWILEDGLPVRMGMQLHKFIWDPSARGV